MPDIPDVDETFALDYATDHDREVCRILDRRLTLADPSSYQIYSVIKEVATQGGFNYETVVSSLVRRCPHPARSTSSSSRRPWAKRSHDPLTPGL